MTKQKSARLLNDFGSIDRKQPFGKQQDMRTSTYLGHKLLDDTMLGNKLHVKYKETRHYHDDPVIETNKCTDYKDNYVCKFGNPYEIRNVALNGKMNFMKPFYECNLKFLTRPMRPVSSVTHSDFLWQPETHVPTPIPKRMPSAVSSTKISIDRNKHGYSKYLDPAATTTSLDYCYRTSKDVDSSIAAKDTITFWNWKNIENRDKNVFRVKDMQLCDKLPSNECIKRRCEFTSQVKVVPNSGLTTEVRDNFTKPNKSLFVFNDRNVKSNMIFSASEPTMDKTEYGVFGSGDRTQKFV